MAHESDQRLADYLKAEEERLRFGFSDEMPELGSLRTEFFGESELPECHLRFELIFWSLYLDDEPGVWGTYFCPDDGIWPGRSEITAECLGYWSHRAASSAHPLLRARYADVVWDLSQALTGKKPSFDLLKSAIKNYRDAILNNRIDPPGWQWELLGRLFYLCTSTGQSEELTVTFEALREYCAKADNSDAGCEEYICSIRPKAADEVTGDQKIELLERDFFSSILQLEKRYWPEPLTADLASRQRALLDTSPLDRGATWSRESLAKPLAHYYWKAGRREDAKNVLIKYGEAVETQAAACQALLAVGLLEGLARLYEHYELHDEKKRVLRVVETRQSEIPGCLGKVTIPFEIPQDEADEWAKSILSQDLPSALAEIARGFFPRISESQRALEELTKGFPLTGYIGSSTVDEKGRKLATIGGSEDAEGRLMQHYLQRFKSDDAFLQILLPKLIGHFSLTPELLIAELLKGSVWAKSRRAILETGVRAFLAGDFISATHLWIPETESAVRQVATNLGLLMQKKNRHGGYDVPNLNDLLSDDTVKTFLSEDLVFYLRSVLSDHRGWNLRNDLCHGIASAASLQGTAARRLFHVMLLLSFIRPALAPAAAT